MAQLKVTQIKSKIGGNSAQRNSLRSLGLRRIGQVVVKPDRPEFRGMIKTSVRHLATVEEADRHGGRRQRLVRGLKTPPTAACPGSAEGQDVGRRRRGRPRARRLGGGTKGTKAASNVRPRLRGRPDAAEPLDTEAEKGWLYAGFGTSDQVAEHRPAGRTVPEGGDVTRENWSPRARPEGELIKVLGTGEVAVALRITAHAFSASAAAKMRSTAGTVTELS